MSHSGCISNPENVVEYCADLRECLAILSNPPPRKPGVWVKQVQDKRLSADGRRYTVTIARAYSGTPRFFLLREDLHDSYWYYPLLGEAVIAEPVGITRGTQPEFMRARQRRLARFDGS